MRISLTASILVALALIHPVHVTFSALREESEGSGYDLDGSGSGSGDWSEKGEMKNLKDHTNSEDVAGGGSKNTLHGFDNTHWPAKDGESGFVVVANSKSFMENKDIFAGVIAGGVTGVTLAATLAAILIYKWHKEDDGGYILGQQRASDEDYNKPNREEVVV